MGFHKVAQRWLRTRTRASFTKATLKTQATVCTTYSQTFARNLQLLTQLLRLVGCGHICVPNKICQSYIQRQKLCKAVSTRGMLEPNRQTDRQNNQKEETQRDIYY